MIRTSLPFASLCLLSCHPDVAWFSYPGTSRSEILAIGEAGEHALCALSTESGVRPFEVPPESTQIFALMYEETLEALGLRDGQIQVTKDDGRLVPRPKTVWSAGFDGYSVGNWVEEPEVPEGLRVLRFQDNLCREIRVSKVVEPDSKLEPTFVIEGPGASSLVGQRSEVLLVDNEDDVSELAHELRSQFALSALRESEDVYWFGGDALRRVRIAGTTLEVLGTFEGPTDLIKLSGVPGEIYALSWNGEVNRFDGRSWTLLHAFGGTGDGDVVWISQNQALARRLGSLVEIAGDNVIVVRQPGLEEVVGIAVDGDLLLATTRAGGIYAKEALDGEWIRVGLTRNGPDDTGPDGSHVKRSGGGYVVTGNGGIGYWVRREPVWTKCAPVPAEAGTFGRRGAGWLSAIGPRGVDCSTGLPCYTRLVFFDDVEPVPPEPLPCFK